MAFEGLVGKDLVGAKVEQSARSYGGPGWAMEEFGESWDTESVVGEVAAHLPGKSVAWVRSLSSGMVTRSA